MSSHELDAGIAKSCIDCRWLGRAAKRWGDEVRAKGYEPELGPGPWCYAERPCVGMSQWMPPETEDGR